MKHKQEINQIKMTDLYESSLMDEKPSNIDQDIIPLPIEHNDDRNEETEDEEEQIVPPPQPQEQQINMDPLTQSQSNASSSSSLSVDHPPSQLPVIKEQPSDNNPPPLPLTDEPEAEQGGAAKLEIKPDEVTTNNNNLPPPVKTSPSSNSNSLYRCPPAYPSTSYNDHYRSPPKYAVSPHLRPPPPLTPMSNIDDKGLIKSDHIQPPMHAPQGIIDNMFDMPIYDDLPPSIQFNIDGSYGNYGMVPPPPPPPSNGNYPPPINDSGYGSGSALHPPPPPPYAIEYRCKICQIVFNTKTELLDHKQDVHGGNSNDDGYGPPAPPSYQQTMSRARSSHREPRDNYSNHDIKRPRFHCNVCGRSFSGKQHFEYHMRTHSGEKPFKCETCGKAFRAKHSLKNHIRIHTGERPYQCKVCGKWFRQLGVMKNHIKNMHSH